MKRFFKLVFAVLGGTFLLGAFLSHNSKPAPSTTEKAIATSASTPEDAARARESLMTQDALTVSAALDYLAHARAHLKTYYADTDDAQSAANELAELHGVEQRHAHGDAKGKALAQQAKALHTQLAVVARQIYASALEHGYVKNGFDWKVRANGTELRLTYALMSKPLVYKLQNESQIDVSAKQYGFTRIVYTNGFESALGMTWTEKITPDSQ